MTKPIIQAHDVAFPRLQAPDLDEMEAFLTDFGMTRAARTEDALYMRGTGPAHHIHVTHLGEPAFLGFAFQANSYDDLERLAGEAGFSGVEPLGEPGGGYHVKTIDPDGFRVEVVYGIETVAPQPPTENGPLNMAMDFGRLGHVKRVHQGASHPKRFGHLALNVADVGASFEWYNRRFGIVQSDRIGFDDSFTVLMFTRCDRGEEYSDHHAILFGSNALAEGESGLNHVSYEVWDIDDVMTGNAYLEMKGRSHEWGIGRHLLGSQVFDYWRDPWGHIHEHWTDGDQLNVHNEPVFHTIEAATTSQWGPNVPSTFGRTIRPEAEVQA